MLTDVNGKEIKVGDRVQLAKSAITPGSLGAFKGGPRRVVAVNSVCAEVEAVPQEDLSYELTAAGRQSSRPAFMRPAVYLGAFLEVV